LDFSYPLSVETRARPAAWIAPEKMTLDDVRKALCVLDESALVHLARAESIRTFARRKFIGQVFAFPEAATIGNSYRRSNA